MYISINKIDTEHLDPKKELKSDKIFKPRGKARCEFHPQGIFSPEIFGYIRQCECGSGVKTTVKDPVKICPNCGITIYNSPEDSYGWINLKVPVAMKFINYSNLPVTKGHTAIKASLAREIASYQSVIADGEVVKLDLADADTVHKIITSEHVSIGADALIELGVSADHAHEMFTSEIIVPAPMYRPAILRVSGKGKNTPIINDMNAALIDIIKTTNNLSGYLDVDFTGEDNAYGQKALIMATYGATITKSVNQFWDEVLAIMTSGRRATVKKELIAGTISNAVRMVLINNSDIDEDTILIGDAAIPILYPYLWDKYQGNMVAIDMALKEGNEMVIANRPPIIGEKSALAFRPRVLSVYHGLLVNHNGTLFDPDLYPETEGIYTCHMNPIVFSGFQADTDGDCLMIFSIFSNQAKADAENLLPSKSYMDYSVTGIRNSIPSNCYLAIKDKAERERVKRHMESWNTPRSEQIEMFHKLSDSLWMNEDVPTAADLINFDDSTKTRIEELTDADTAETISKQLQTKITQYSNDHSVKFITKVMSANSTDIAEAGVFYKNLMASSDDLLITDATDVTPTKMRVEEVIANGEGWYNFNVKGCTTSIAGIAPTPITMSFEEFSQLNPDIEIAVYSPINDIHRLLTERKLSKICCGNIPNNIKRIGLYSTLMITERATQSALSNMNKDKLNKENFILDHSCNGEYTEKEIVTWVKEITDMLSNSPVSRRFYEIALLSRVRPHETHPDRFIIKTMQTSINHSGNLFGFFLFKHNESTLKKMINAKRFNDNSFKAGVAMDVYSVNE